MKLKHKIAILILSFFFGNAFCMDSYNGDGDLTCFILSYSFKEDEEEVRNFLKPYIESEVSSSASSPKAVSHDVIVMNAVKNALRDALMEANENRGRISKSEAIVFASICGVCASLITGTVSLIINYVK